MYSGMFMTYNQTGLEPWEVLLDNCADVSIMSINFLTDVRRGCANRRAGGLNGYVSLTDDGYLRDFSEYTYAPTGAKRSIFCAMPTWLIDTLCHLVQAERQ